MYTPDVEQFVCVQLKKMSGKQKEGTTDKLQREMKKEKKLCTYNHGLLIRLMQRDVQA